MNSVLIECVVNSQERVSEHQTSVQWFEINGWMEGAEIASVILDGRTHWD